jgi:phospholipase C
MKRLLHLAVCLMALVASASATVTVSTPGPGATATSPTQYVASATTTTCAKGVGSMGIYVNNKLIYVVSGAKLNTKITLAPGFEHTVVQEWDHCGGSTFTTINVTVVIAPAVTLAANPTSIASGGSSVLTATASHATKVTLTGSDGSSYPLGVSGGSVTVSPKATTTYTAHASGATGTTPASANTTVTVTALAQPTVSIGANPTSITAGSSSSLTVAASNATQVTVTGSDGSSYPLGATGGTQSVSPTATATYTAHASGATGTTPASATATVTVTAAPAQPTVSISASPTSITAGGSSSLTVAATNATQVTISGSDGSTYTLPVTGGTQQVSPSVTTTYTAEATSNGTASATATATVTVAPAGSAQSITHVVFMLQENHSFDNYFGMLNPYRHNNGYNIGADGVDYEVDGIEDKLNISNEDDEGVSIPLFKFATTCIDDMSSAWLESYGDVNRYNFLATRPIVTDGFVHTAEGFAKSCASSGTCSGTFTDLVGQRAMGYYDESFLNYYYYMASQFAVSNRWFSPLSSKSVPNRIATFTGGTTQGLVFAPGSDDKLPQLNIPTIFQELDNAKVSWKIYYTVTQGSCLSDDNCSTSASARFPAVNFSTLSYSFRYLYENPTQAACTGTTQPSSVVGDSTNSFCIDPNHIAPIANYYTDLTNATLPSFSFIESGSGVNDEHPGSGQSILIGQAEVAKVINAFMASPEWGSSVFFFSYDEGGGPYDHVPPVPGHSNDNSDPSISAPDISTITVNADGYNPCVPSTSPATTHCDLRTGDPGVNSGDAPALQGFAAQLGFRLPNIIVSPFTRAHYVGNNPMDHTAVIKFVENRFINSSAHLTPRDAAQPNLLDFFDFNNTPWATPPIPPTPVSQESLGYNPCTPTKLQ